MTMRELPEDAVVKAITVACAPERAFQLWTTRVSAWWPAGHSLSGRRDTELFIEQRAGGRFYERTSDGAEYDWGEIVAWEPPHRLAFDWYLGSGPEQPSRVEITFNAAGAAETQVRVVHRGPALLGDLWPARSPRFAASWETVFAAYEAAVEASRR